MSASRDPAEEPQRAGQFGAGELPQFLLVAAAGDQQLQVRPGRHHQPQRVQQHRHALAGLVEPADEADGAAGPRVAGQRLRAGEELHVDPVGDDHRVAAEVLDLHLPGQFADRDPAGDLLQERLQHPLEARSASATAGSRCGRWRRSGRRRPSAR